MDSDRARPHSGWGRPHRSLAGPGAALPTRRIPGPDSRRSITVDRRLAHLDASRTGPAQRTTALAAHAGSTAGRHRGLDGPAAFCGNGDPVTKAWTDVAHDAGLQVERTQLAWQRTVLSVAGLTVLVLRTSMAQGDFFTALTGAAATCALGDALWLEWAERRRLQRPSLTSRFPGRPSGQTPAVSLAILAAASAVLAGIGFLQAIARATNWLG